jgi:hypothetical protein
MNRIESTRSGPNTGRTRLRETMPAMSGQNWKNSPPSLKAGGGPVNDRRAMLNRAHRQGAIQ